MESMIQELEFLVLNKRWIEAQELMYDIGEDTLLSNGHTSWLPKHINRCAKLEPSYQKTFNHDSNHKERLESVVDGQWLAMEEITGVGKVNFHLLIHTMKDKRGGKLKVVEKMYNSQHRGSQEVHLFNNISHKKLKAPKYYGIKHFDGNMCSVYMEYIEGGLVKDVEFKDIKLNVMESFWSVEVPSTFEPIPNNDALVGIPDYDLAITRLNNATDTDSKKRLVTLLPKMAESYSDSGVFILNKDIDLINIKKIGDEIKVIDWDKWAIVPIGSYLIDSYANVELQSMIQRVVDSRSDINNTEAVEGLVLNFIYWNICNKPTLKNSDLVKWTNLYSMANLIEIKEKEIKEVKRFERPEFEIKNNTLHVAWDSNLTKEEADLKPISDMGYQKVSHGMYRMRNDGLINVMFFDICGLPKEQYPDQYVYQMWLTHHPGVENVNREYLISNIPESVFTDIKDGRCFLAIELFGEGHTDRSFKIIDKVMEELNITKNNVIYLTAGIDTFDYYQEYKKKSKSDFNYHIISFDFWKSVLSGDVRLKDHGSFNVGVKDKLLLCKNNRNRIHRTKFVSYLYHHGLLGKSYISYRTLGRFDHHLQKVIRYCENEHEKEMIQKFFSDNNNRLPFEIDSSSERTNCDEAPQPGWMIMLNLNDVLKSSYVNSYFSVVTETFFYETYHTHRSYTEVNDISRFITEKTYKPIIMKHPFVLLARPYTLEFLKELGYKSFHPFIDESYDTIKDNDLRLKAVCDEVVRLSKKTNSEWVEWQNSVKDIVEHNHRFFYNSKPFFMVNGQNITGDKNK